MITLSYRNVPRISFLGSITVLLIRAFTNTENSPVRMPYLHARFPDNRRPEPRKLQPVTRSIYKYADCGDHHFELLRSEVASTTRRLVPSPKIQR